MPVPNKGTISGLLIREFVTKETGHPSFLAEEYLEDINQSLMKVPERKNTGNASIGNRYGCSRTQGALSSLYEYIRIVIVLIQ
jgi:hypothetical protein